MKKLYTLSILFLSVVVTYGQGVVISRVVMGALHSDGCSGTSADFSSPRIVELYVSGTVDLTNYRIQMQGNGATSPDNIIWNTGVDLTPLGTMSNSFVYIVGFGATTFSEMYPSIILPNLGTSVSTINGNGNDSYRIVTTDGQTPFSVISVIDQFGNPLNITGGSADYNAPWAYQYSYAKRVNGIGPNGGNFVNSSFIYGGNGFFFPTANRTCPFVANAIQLGTFTLAKQEFEISGLKIYPNPVTNGNLYITSDSGKAKQVVIYDVLGKQVVKASVAKQPVNVSALDSGVYMVKVSEDGKTATKKLVIK